MATTVSFRNPICKYGHDKRVTGVSGFNCKECNKLKMWNSGAPIVPRKHCRNGHELEVSGTTPGRGCTECWERLWRNGNWKRYGVKNCDESPFTHLDYDRAYQVQSGKCLICEVHQSQQKHRLHADHDHLTGRFRGLLCFTCNAAVGNVKENLNTVTRLGEYLKAQMGR